MQPKLIKVPIRLLEYIYDQCVFATLQADCQCSTKHQEVDDDESRTLTRSKGG